jgi:hypothetical protein
VTWRNYAKFKASGTINGMGDYKFMLWAGNDDLDTFHFKIWGEEELGNETVIYDDGYEGSGFENEQPISGDSIVTHTKK